MNRSRVTGNLSSHGNIFVDIANDRVGIGSTIPGEKLSLPDSAKIALGDSADFQLYHTSSGGSLFNSTGYIHIRASSNQVYIDGSTVHLRNHAGSETFLKGIANGAVELRYDNVKKFETQSTGAKVTGQLNVATSGNNEGIKVTNSANNSSIMFIASGGTDTGGFRLNHNGPNSQITIDRTNGSGDFSSNLIFISSTGDLKLVNDNSKLQVGASSDLSIYHDGSHSYIDDTGTGNLKLRSNNFRVSNADESKLSATFQAAGAAELYYNNVKKAYTENNGFYVTDTGKEAMSRVLSPSGYAARLDLTSDAGANNEDNYRIEVGTDQLLKIQGKPSGNYTTFVQINQSGHVLPGTDSSRDLGSNTVRWRNIYADTLYGNGANLTGITQTTINNNANNRVITGSGTANTLEAESTLTFDSGGQLSIGGSDEQKILLTGASNPYIRFQEGTTNKAFIQWNATGYLELFNQETNEGLRIQSGSNGLKYVVDNTAYKVWHELNDGSGSGLDADTLDGIQGSSYLRSDANDTASGALTFTNTQLHLSGHWYSRFYSGTQNYIHLYPNGHTGNASSTDIRAYNGSGADVFKITGGSATGLTWRGQTIWTAENDGAGSTLDADTVDGIQAASFIRGDQDFVLTDSNSWYLTHGGVSDWAFRLTNNTGTNNYVYMSHGTHGMHIRNDSSTTSTYLLDVYAVNGNRFQVRGADAYTTINGNKVYHAGNDGAGSGLDADTLDGVNSTSFLRSDVNDTQAPQRIEFKANETYNYDTIADSAGNKGCIEVANYGVGNDAFMGFHAAGDFACYFGLDADVNRLAVGGWSMGAVKYSILHTNFASIRGSSAGQGYDIRLSMDGSYAEASVGHTANNHEGIFWHNGANYGIYRTAGVWSGNYQQLRLDWPTGIIIDGGDQYGLSGVKFESHLYPDANNTRDIGSTSLRWRNIYTNDLNLSNEGGANDVDGTWGNYTIQEGEDDLFLINKRNGKKYQFMLKEVS